MCWFMCVLCVCRYTFTGGCAKPRRFGAPARLTYHARAQSEHTRCTTHTFLCTILYIRANKMHELSAHWHARYFARKAKRTWRQLASHEAINNTAVCLERACAITTMHKQRRRKHNIVENRRYARCIFATLLNGDGSGGSGHDTIDMHNNRCARLCVCVCQVTVCLKRDLVSNACGNVCETAMNACACVQRQ